MPAAGQIRSAFSDPHRMGRPPPAVQNPLERALAAGGKSSQADVAPMEFFAVHIRKRALPINFYDARVFVKHFRMGEANCQSIYELR
jgi:hypothetical protein